MIIDVKVEIPDNNECTGDDWTCQYFLYEHREKYCDLFGRTLPNDKPCMECCNARDVVASQPHFVKGDINPFGDIKQ